MWRRKAASMSNCPTTPVIGSLTYWKKKNILLEAGTGRDGPEQFTNAIKLQQELRGEQTVWARPRKGSMAKRVLTGSDIEALPPGGELVVPPDSIVTDRAREIAAERGVAIRTEGSPAGPSAGQRVQPAPARVVAIGADHGGFELKETLKRYLTEWGYTVTDFGTDSAKAVDYPDFALAVAQAVARGDAWRGIMVDSVGVGSAMAANKVRGIRAAPCSDRATARSSREHNDANVLTLGGRFLQPEEAREIVRVWLDTAFAGGRHQGRVDKITAIEKSEP